MLYHVAVLFFCLIIGSCVSFSTVGRISTLSLQSKLVNNNHPLFAAKKGKVITPAVDANGKEYWQGDWVCAGKKDINIY